MIKNSDRIMPKSCEVSYSQERSRIKHVSSAKNSRSPRWSSGDPQILLALILEFDSPPS